MAIVSDHLADNLRTLTALLGGETALPTDPSRLWQESGPNATLVLRTASGGHAAVHSRRDPVAEAGQQLDTALGGRPMPPLIVLVGIGLGYLIDVIEARSAGTRIVAIEPEPLCIRPLLARRDFTRLWESGRLLLLWGPDYRGWTSGWQFWDGLQVDPVTLVHPVLGRQSTEGLEGAKQVIERMVFGARANAGARESMQAPYLLNTLRNLPLIAASGNVADLFDRFRGIPAVLVAAGPSLDRNIKDLPAVEGRALIISVDTALRPLLAAGIEPHVVVGLDLQPMNARHISGLGAGLRTWLVAEGSMDPSAFDGFEGRVMTFRVADHHPWPWLRSIGLDRGLLRAWGSVLSTAWDLARRLGCDPLIFTGADLAYTGNQPYCRNTIYEELWAESIRHCLSWEVTWDRWMQKPALHQPGWNGVTVRTTPTLVAFRDWLVEQSLATSGLRFINATGGGILVGGRFEQLPLDTVIAGLRPVRGLDVVARPIGPTVALADIVDRVVTEWRVDVPPLGDWLRILSGGDSVGSLSEVLAGAVAGVRSIRGARPR